MDASLSSDDDSPHELSIVVDEISDEPPNQHELGESQLNEILQAVRCTLDRHERAAAAISIRIVSDDAIAELHQRMMDIPGPTDVLTFDLSDDHPQDATAEISKVEGDIVISIDTAAREAKNRNHPLLHEIMLYAIHATLHLLGFDDINEEDAVRMHAEEDDILKALGIGAVYGRPVT